MVTDKTRFFKKQFGDPNLAPTGLNQVPNEVFRHFIEIGSFP